MLSAVRGDDWLALTSDPLPVGDVYDWAVRPDCGAVVLFSGTVRDHAEGRDGVDHLVYEAYGEAVEPRLAEIAAEARRRWPTLGRIALLHRTGRLELGESSVLVVVSTPHRGGVVRGWPVRDRRPEGVGTDLEARDLARRKRVGHWCDADHGCRDGGMTPQPAPSLPPAPPIMTCGPAASR